MLSLRSKTVQTMILFTLFLLYSLPLQAVSWSKLTEQDSQNNCTVLFNGINLRAGPGTQFNKVGQLARNTILIVIGRNTDGSWVFGSSTTGKAWVAAQLVKCSLPISQLPVTTELLESQTPIAMTATQEPSALPTVSATENIGDVTLLGPLDEKLSGRLTFHWQATFTLAANQGFQLIFWEPGQDPLANGFPVQGPTSANKVIVDLDKVMDFVTQLKPGKEYLWGVALVRLHPRPEKRLKVLSGGHRFSLTSSDASGPNAPVPTIPPPPK